MKVIYEHARKGVRHFAGLARGTWFILEESVAKKYDKEGTVFIKQAEGQSYAVVIVPGSSSYGVLGNAYIAPDAPVLVVTGVTIKTEE